VLIRCFALVMRAQEEGAERYVLDLRNNGGGLFPAGVQVAKLFIRAGDIVLIADSDGIRDSYSADFTAIEDKKPLSVRQHPELPRNDGLGPPKSGCGLVAMYLYST
jgi:hypothetical protein